MIEINTNPSRRELAWFGVLFLVFFGIVGAALFRLASTPTPAIVVWAAAGLVTVVYYAARPVRRPLYLGWMSAAFPIGWVMSQVMMAFVFYVVLTPIGLIMRMIGRDPMHRRFDESARSYWVERDSTDDPSRYFRQF